MEDVGIRAYATRRAVTRVERLTNFSRQVSVASEKTRWPILNINKHIVRVHNVLSVAFGKQIPKQDRWHEAWSSTGITRQEKPRTLIKCIFQFGSIIRSNKPKAMGFFVIVAVVVHFQSQHDTNRQKKLMAVKQTTSLLLLLLDKYDMPSDCICFGQNNKRNAICV